MWLSLSKPLGLRLTEQFHSRWDCLNTEQGILTIPLSKSGKTRHVILTDAALEIVKGLSSWMHSPFLFPSPLTSAQPMQGRNFVVKIYEPGLKRAKIEGVTWHTLRHTFASRAVMAGVDIRTVQELMGHSTITMTMRYAHLSPAHLRTAVNRASLGAIAAKSASGTGSKTGSSDNQRVEQGPVRITEPSEISIGMSGGAGRVRTAASQFCSLPELSEVPLTYTSGQPVAKAATSHVAKDALELRPMRIVAAHLPSTPTRNIFEAAETPTSEKRLVRAAVNKKEVPPPIPVPVVAMPVVPPAPPMPSPEEVAEQAARLARERARQQLREVMAQYRYLGYLTGRGEQQAFLGKGQEIYIIHLGDTLDGQFQVASITPTTVKILAAHADVETTIQLKTDSSVEPS
ncbi:MAG: site-specific integrase [Nitrospira sp.]|nr:site-specific integrase [Nitrospira sp.]